MSPNSSPRYGFATSSCSENDPTICSRPFEHSITNAAEHRLEYNSHMYDPSVAATIEPSAIESCIHSVPPDTDILSHSQVFPHNSRTTKNDVGAFSGSAIDVVDRSRQCSPSVIVCTKHTVYNCPRRWLCEKWNLLGFFPATNTSSVTPSSLEQ
jgi:hypothetical protein